MFQIFDEFGIEQNLEDRTCCSSSKVLRERTLTSGLMKKRTFPEPFIEYP